MRAVYVWMCGALLVPCFGQRQIPSQTAAPGSFQDFSASRYAPARRVIGVVSGSITLPAASTSTNQEYLVTNGSTSSDCTVGGGSTRVNCVSNGSAWVAVGGSGGGGTVDPAALKSAIYCPATSGSGTAYVCTPTNSSVLATGQFYIIGIDTTNTGNATVAIGANSAVPLIHKNSEQFAAGQLVVGDFIAVDFDGTNLVPIYEQRSVNQGCIVKGEAAVNGNETITDCAPASLAVSYSFIDPSGPGITGEVLTSAGAGGQRTWSSAGTPNNSSTPWVPWTGYFVGTTALIANANDVIYYALPPIVGSRTVSTITYYSGNSAGTEHAAWALYSFTPPSTCALIQQSTTAVSPNFGAVQLTISSPPTLTSGTLYLIAVTSDVDTFRIEDIGADATIYSGIVNAGTNKYTMVSDAGHRSSGTTTLTFPATCGTPTAVNRTPPWVALGN